MKAANSNVNIEDLDARMLQFLSDLENKIGYELIITSGYRGPDHPIEARKTRPGEHSTGLAVDVAVIGGSSTYNLVADAIALGCERIGINRKRNFVHLGLDNSRVRSIWTY